MKSASKTIRKLLRPSEKLIFSFKYNILSLPFLHIHWLASEAVEIDRNKKRKNEECRGDLRSRLRNDIDDEKENVLSLKIIKSDGVVFGVFLMNLWHPEQNLDESFMFVEMDERLKGFDY
ncbi:hypothetical protein E2542_SST27484 [Spatholobus suberectus]|nr:hypothetical protein E2542_SST27484 [Spatholobus suberectus]